jgi:hypothetical protein
MEFIYYLFIKKLAPPKIKNLIQLFYSLAVKVNSYGTLYYVLMDPPLRAVRDVNRLQLAPNLACSRTSEGSGRRLCSFTINLRQL